MTTATAVAPRPAAHRDRWAVGAAVAVVTVLTWPIRVDLPLGDVDWSWQIALSMAWERRLPYGSEIVYSYGPLGFLGQPMTTSRAGLLAWAVQVATQATLVGLVTARLRRVVALPWAAAGALALSLAIGPEGGAPALMTAWVVIAVLWAVIGIVHPVERWTFAATAAVAAAAAAATLFKADTGLICVVFAVIGVLARVEASWSDGGRARAATVAAHAGVFVAAYAVAGAALWRWSGGHLSDLPTWFDRMGEMVAGFGRARGLARSTTATVIEVTSAVLTTVLAASLAFRAAGRRSARSGAVAAAATTLAMFLAFRQGFMRHDPQHVRQFFAVAIAMPVAFAGAVATRWVGAACAVALVAFVPGQLGTGWSTGLPTTWAERVGRSVHIAASGGERDAFIEAGKVRLRERYQLPASFVARIDGPVDVVPFEVGVAHAYDLDWQPRPIFQDHMATTTALDRINAAAFRSPQRPKYVLRGGGEEIDENLERFDPPAQNVELMCRYRVVATAATGSIVFAGAEVRPVTWQLLRATNHRCGPVDPLPPIEVRYGEEVTVPDAPPGHLTLVRFEGIDDAWHDRVRTWLLRGPASYLVAQGADSYRLTPGSQGAWHLLDAPACRSAEISEVGARFDRFTMSSRRRPSTPPADGRRYEVQFGFAKVSCDRASPAP